MRPLVFFHVMKCGGTSVRAALARGATSVFRLDGQAAMAAVGGIVAQEDNWRFRRELLTYLLAGGHHDVILGHFRYHRAHEPYLADAHFVTVLRRPVERFISLYNYRRARAEAADVTADLPLAQLLREPGWRDAGRTYVDTFCGDPSLGPGSDEAVEAAIANLRRFSAVGSTENLDTFGAEVGRLVKRPIEVPVRNRGVIDPGIVDDAEMAMLEEICAPDQQVYDALFAVD